jgi:dipeptide transport system ATP-binding protein
MILEAKNLKKHYPVGLGLRKGRAQVRALDGVSFKLERGKTLAIVGESGCGKSTLARVLLQMEPATSGEILIEGQPASTLARSEVIRSVQMIFQDPYGSINPRKKAWQIISEPHLIQTGASREECRGLALEMMRKVGLRPELADRYPHMFSGGQRQRIGIARALILRPKVLLCDEPVSALDVSIQAQVLNLLMDLQDELKLSYVLISHDLSVVRHIADDVLVMYLGRTVEQGTRTQIFESPRHPYTRALLASSPHASKIEASALALSGELPSPLNPPPGCSLSTRCPLVTERCREQSPALQPLQESAHQVACFVSQQIESTAT